MKKLIVEINKLDIDHWFIELEESGMLRKLQAKVFKKVYKAKLNGLFRILRNKLTKWLMLDTENQLISIEEGQDEYITNEYNKLNNFFNSEENVLKNNPEYIKFKSERIVIQILSAIKQRLSKSKDRAISLALGSSTVMEFFNKAGITIQIKVE